MTDIEARWQTLAALVEQRNTKLEHIRLMREAGLVLTANAAARDYEAWSRSVLAGSTAETVKYIARVNALEQEEQSHG